MEIPLISLFDEDETEFQIPHQSSDQHAAVQLRAHIDDEIDIQKGYIVAIPLGVILDLKGPESICGLLLPRTGLGGQGFTLMNGVGLINPGCKEELVGYFVNQTDHAIRVKRGDCIAQLMFVNFIQPTFRLTH